MRRKITILISVLALLLVASAPAAAAPAPSSAPAPTDSSASTCHIVRRGETLFSIGRRYGVSPWAIAAANHLANPNRIYAGQCLYIPRGGCCYLRCHVVRPGETLFSIGRRYGVSPWAIASANHLANPSRIYAGQCLYIPCNGCYW